MTLRWAKPIKKNKIKSSSSEHHEQDSDNSVQSCSESAGVLVTLKWFNKKGRGMVSLSFWRDSVIWLVNYNYWGRHFTYWERDPLFTAEILCLVSTYFTVNGNGMHLMSCHKTNLWNWFAIYFQVNMPVTI